MSAKLKWLIVIQLLLNELALCRVPPPLAPKNTLLAGAGVRGEAEERTNEGHQSSLGSRLQSGLPFAKKPDVISLAAQTQETSANRVISKLKAKLHGQIQDHLYIQGNVTCEELLSASTVDDPSSSAFPRELLGLSLVPVLVVAGCPQEAQTLVVKLYDLLGVEDTEELLMEMEALMERRMSRSVSPPPAAASAASLSERDQTWHQIDAVMFNIQQIAKAEEDSSEDKWQCEGWTRVNGTTLVGTAVEGATGDLEEAVNTCERLGVQCAGVTNSGTIKPGKYQAVLKRGSRILPSESSGCECWIRQCMAEEDVLTPAASGGRMKRSPQRTCINKSEQRVYNVMEWIPAVSTLYNLGTAVYYASVNCSETAKERALLSAVDLSTDALMVATGGTAGVAGYALGAGVKTGVKAGVKYLLNYMKEEDDMQVNQVSWEEGVFTVQ